MSSTDCSGTSRQALEYPASLDLRFPSMQIHNNHDTWSDQGADVFAQQIHGIDSPDLRILIAQDVGDHHLSASPAILGNAQLYDAVTEARAVTALYVQGSKKAQLTVLPEYGLVSQV